MRNLKVVIGHIEITSILDKESTTIDYAPFNVLTDDPAVRDYLIKQLGIQKYRLKDEDYITRYTPHELN